MKEKIQGIDNEIKSYTLKELCEKDSTTAPSVRNWKIKDQYFKVQFEHTQAKYRYENWKQAKPYSIRYIRREDIKDIIEKRYWKISFTPDKYDRRKEDKKNFIKWNDHKWQKLK